MSTTKKIVLGGQTFEVGPFVIGQVEIISPIIWKLIKAMGSSKEMIINSDPVSLFLNLEVTSEMVADMTTAIAAALPKKEGKRYTPDEVREMEATFLDMWLALFSIISLCGFGGMAGEVVMGEPTAGAEMSS